MPLSLQRQKRRWTVFHLPYSGGRSLHGAPVLKIQNTRKREKFKAEHGDELSRLQKAIWLREKLVKSLGLASPLDKEQRAALKAERTRLEAEREALLPKLEEVKAEMAELNRIRYWTRKVIPDALPHVLDGRVSVEDAMETASNRKELEQVEDEAVQMAARQPQEQEKQKVKQQGEIASL